MFDKCRDDVVWWICGKTRKHRISSEDIRDNSGVAPFELK